MFCAVVAVNALWRINNYSTRYLLYESLVLHKKLCKPDRSKAKSIRRIASYEDFSIPTVHLCPAQLWLTTPPGAKKITLRGTFSTSHFLRPLAYPDLDPAVDRQPGSPRGGTRREGSACAPFDRVRLRAPEERDDV